MTMHAERVTAPEPVSSTCKQEKEHTSLSPHLPTTAGVDHCPVVPRGRGASQADDVVRRDEHGHKAEAQPASLRPVQREGRRSRERVRSPVHEAERKETPAMGIIQTALTRILSIIRQVAVVAFKWPCCRQTSFVLLPTVGNLP